MTIDRDLTPELAEQVREAAKRATPLRILGGGTKSFYSSGPVEGRTLSVVAHRGIVSYEPTELVITARAGTPLAEIEQALAERRQMLGFEPPHFGPGATLGGTIACGLSGPRRPYAGAARDFVLGVRILNGKGECLRFGGQVMKNVAGYDVARLMAGALGTLGVLLEVSLKVLPRPAVELTLALPMDAAEAIRRMNELAGRPLPLSAACHLGDTLYIRLSGSETAVKAARQRIGGEPVAQDEAFWLRVREHTHGFFAGDLGIPLWRLSVPPATPPLELPGKWMLDWGGAQRWLRSPAPAEEIFEAARAAGGYATCWRGGGGQNRFQPLPPALAALHRRLKAAFDPAGILNPGCLGSDTLAGAA
jgi:glycolate oxidase FAD binding subunit